MNTPTLIFAGGGTGGHIFPALAIAQSARERAGVRSHFVCSDRPLDAELLESASRDALADAWTPIPARPFGLRPRAFARLLASWGECVRRVRKIIRDERERLGEHVVLVAMGGFVAAPAVQAARAERCPVVLVNLDAVPGLANRWIARRTRHRFAVTSRPEKPPGLDWRVIAPIVRKELRHLPDPESARASFGVSPDAPTLLITGGSQGARTINALMVALVEARPDAFRTTRWQIIHQCGRDDAETLSAIYEAAGISAHVTPFIGSMANAWAAADAAVARAGAGSVAEAWATLTPTLFLPYPYHADQHQRLNALPLVDREAALLGTDRIEPGPNLETNGPALLTLLEDAPRREAMNAALHTLGPADGADSIADFLLSQECGL